MFNIIGNHTISFLMECKWVWLILLQVKDLEDGVVQLLAASDECMHLSEAIQSIGDELEPGPEVTFRSKYIYWSSAAQLGLLRFELYAFPMSFVCSQWILRRSLTKKLQNQRLDHRLTLRTSPCWENSGKPSGYVFLVSCTTFCILVWKKSNLTYIEQEHWEENSTLLCWKKQLREKSGKEDEREK